MSETGHAKNVSEFEILFNFVSSLGTAFNPTKIALKLPNLRELLTNAQNSLIKVEEDFSEWKSITNQRETSFNSAEKLWLRAVNGFSVSEVDELTMKDVKSVVRKLQGRRAKPKPEPQTAGEAVKAHSVAQTSYDSKTGHLSQIVSIFENHSYQPNESELKVETLKGVLEDLKVKNRQVSQASLSLSTARLERNKILYDSKNGLVRLAQDVKTYIKAVFGADSPQFRQISNLQFKKIER